MRIGKPLLFTGSGVTIVLTVAIDLLVICMMFGGILAIFSFVCCNSWT